MRTYDRDVHHRQSSRLKGYDYSQAGAHFVTACTWRRESLLGEVVHGSVCLSEWGRLVQAVWDELPTHYPGMQGDAFVIMPNHVHGIIVLMGFVGAGLRPAPTTAGSTRAGSKPAPTGAPAVPEIVRALKTFSARRINVSRGTPGAPVWQRNYWEHVIRSDAECDRVREYIRTNPERWSLDRENPALAEPWKPEAAWQV